MVTRIEHQAERGSAVRLWRAGAISVVAAASANVVVYVLLLVIGVPLNIQLGGPGSPIEPLTVLLVILSSSVPAIAATLLFAVLTRVTSRGVLIFQIVAALVLIVSLGGPLSLPVPPVNQAALALMHVVAGLVITGGLVRLSRQE